MASDAGRVEPEILGGFGSIFELDDPSVFEGDGWGVAHVRRRSAMIRGGLTALECHWYPNVAERRIGPDRYNQLGSIFVTASGIYVRDDALNMARVPLNRWGQMSAVWMAVRDPGTGVTLDWSTTLTHHWVRRPEDGGARLVRDHLDPIVKTAAPADDVSTYQPARKLECAGCGKPTTLSCSFCGRPMCARHPWSSDERGHWIGIGYLECQRSRAPLSASFVDDETKLAEPEGR